MTASLTAEAMQEFIQAYPGLGVRPAIGGGAVFQGDFEFTALWDNVEVTDTFELRIEVRPYPENLPRVFELGGRIKPHADEHAFASGQLCLGSELRLRTIIGPTLNLVRFADQCIVPYLYATARRGAEGRYVLGELAHDGRGLIEDYKDLLAVQGEANVRAALRTLTTKPSSADGHPCPCGCGRRLAQCEYRNRIRELRTLAPRKVFRSIFDATFPVARKD